MKNNIEDQLHAAFTEQTPDCLESILKDIQKEKGTDIVMTDTQFIKQKKNKTSLFKRYTAMVAAVAILLCGGIVGGIWYSQTAADVTVSLDVNPSIEMQVDSKEKVKSVTPLNEDAKEILGTMDFTDTNLDVAVNAVIGAMVQKGYLSELSNSILVSVDGKNNKKTADVQNKVAAKIDKVLRDNAVDSAIVTQNIGKTEDAVKAFAEKYGLSVGKAQYIYEICQVRPQYKPEDLVSLTVNELNMMTENHKENMPSLNFQGNASQKKYIGEEKATELALSHFSLITEQVKKTEVDFESEKINGVPTMVYEVELETDTKSFEVELDAVTGELLKSEMEPLDVDDENDKDTEKDDEDDEDDEEKEDDDATFPTEGVLTKENAMDKALAAANVSQDGAKDISCDEEMKKGKAYYEVEFDDGAFSYEILLDAVTGDIVRIDKENAEMEKKEPVTLAVDEKKAKDIAFGHFSVSEKEITELTVDEDDGIYEVEFRKDGIEYTCVINGMTEEILKSEKETDD